MSLYAVTADRAWLKRAQETLRFADAQFKEPIGYVASSGAAALKPKPQVDENVMMTRVANLLHHYTGEPEYRRIAEHAMRFVAAPVIVDGRGIQVGANLLADREFTSPPLHFTVVGAKDDPAARKLFRAALAHPATYKRVEWWDRREGPLPNADVPYPELEKAAIFACNENACSLPMFSVESFTSFVSRTNVDSP